MKRDFFLIKSTKMKTYPLLCFFTPPTKKIKKKKVNRLIVNPKIEN